ncbi:hypothetical protein BHK98_09455 [Hornefia porci]|uniref:BIG2 domain-containing protein n=1 Tax=Hornefia porci TaxID=2652292 RepID=A0A1Q9JJF5_9FIRM|nr:Ig-like domain-containing protein [Hornefia porci]OLR56271.1 hypothetical protein BHK98_09455 [Hornefia porci]
MKALKTAGKQAGVAILAVMLAISMLTIMLPQTTYANTAPKQPVASINGQSGTNVSFVYSGKTKKVSWDSGSYENDPSISYTKKGDTTVTDEQPTDVGSYTLRLHFPSDPLGTVTYDAVTVTQDFTITQDTNTVSGLTMADFTYGNTPGKPSASSKYESGAITYAYYEDAACTVPVAISSTTAAGTYYVRATSKGTDNYKSDSATASFRILKKSAVSVPGTVTKDYTGAEITGLTDSDAYTVANAVHTDAGTYDITLTLKSGYTWEDGSTDPKTVKFTINKKKVAVPTVASKEYNGEAQKADIADTAEYAVTTNNGGKDGGSYDVVLTLKDTNNYVWANGDTKTTTVKFIITRTENYWIEGLQIQSWRVGETAQEPTAKAKWGTVQYKYYDENGSAIAKSEVSAAGTYYVEAYVEATDSLKALTSGKVKFQVYDKKTGVVLPAAADKAYTGEKQTSGLKATKDYTIVSDEGGTDVGTYTVTLRLSDRANCTWADGTSEDKEISWKITKAKNSWDTALSMADWTYGDKASSPAAEPHFGRVSEYKYYEKDGNSYTRISKPKNAGTYYVKAFVNGTDNYEALESGYVKFNIERQAVKVPTLKSKVYNAKAQTPDIDSELYGLYDYEAVTGAGTYTVKLKLKDSANYRWYGGKGSIATTEFKITKGENEFTKALSIEGWAYGKTPNEPSAEAKWGKVEYHYYTDKACTNEIDIDEETGAGTYYVKAVVPGNGNYDEISTSVSFKIAKAKVEIPTLKDLTYTGKAQKADIPKSPYYNEVPSKNEEHVNVGTYTAYIELTETDNFTWADGTLTKQHELEYKIVQAKNEWTEELKATSKNCDGDPAEVTAKAKFGDVEYTYYDSDLKKLDSAPTRPGKYFVEASVAGTDNYTGLKSDKVSFRITQADNEWTGELKAESKDYDGDPAEVSAAAKYGTVTYKYYDTDMNELDQAPTKPGAYYVKAIVEETDNYKGLESKTVKFTIKKLVVDIPAYTKASKYNGKLQTAEIPESGLYEVVENKGGIDAGEYKVVLKLKDPSIYAWNDGDQDGDGTITLPYLITKDDNEWTKDLSIDNWTYGKTAKKPVAEAKYGDVVYTYYSSSKKQLSAAPTMPGTYYVKATVTGTEGFSKLASGYVQFKIYKPALVLKAAPRTKTTETLKWSKLTKIDGYMVYYAKCGRDMKCYKTYSKSRTSTVMRSLKKNTAYKYKVKAYKVVNGKKVIVASASVAHALTGGYSKKYTDAKSISVPDKYVNLSVGESYKVKVKVTKLKKGRSLLDYDHDMYVRFSSSDSSIAYVAADGTIKGKQAGTCRINATALNGMTAVVYVTVVK